MNITGLSFNALPPIDLPFRFFITACLFIIGIALLVLFSGETIWVSRWHPSMLALTHAFTLGFITSVMMGALLQLLPVLGGIGFAKPRLIAGFCHFFHLVGTSCLLVAFILPSPWLISSAMLLLFLGIGGYIIAAAWVLVKRLSQGDSIIGIRFAIAGLLLTLILGGLLLSKSLGYEITTSDKNMTNIHALWGLVGWGSLLIISVSFQVIPMFHVAPSFPKKVTRYITFTLFSLLIIMLINTELTLPFLFITHAIFALSLLKVISQRKRKVADITVYYWQLAAVSLLLLNVLYFLPEGLIADMSANKSLIMAAIFIYFYLVSVIQGMLIKIMPFLSYTHLQQRCLTNFSAMKYIPHMHEFLAKKQAKTLFILHIFTGMALVVTLIFPSVYWLFGSLLLLEFSLLLFLMIKTIRLYFQIARKISTVK